MKPLIDIDMVLYQVCFSAEYPKDEPIKSFEYVKETFDNLVSNIAASAGGIEEPSLYLTGEGNFREKIATTKPYKGTRVQEKPFHYNNLKAYILSLPNTILVEGMEADDAMTIAQLSGEEGTTIICTRDKDLRMTPGWHYGWECGRQPEYYKRWVEELGHLSYEKKKLDGSGILFFYAQCLMGDRVDNIPGLDGYGPKKAFDLLHTCTTEWEAFSTVMEHYQIEHQENAETYLLEQGRLLWMVRELDEEGEPVMWEFPKEKDNE